MVQARECLRCLLGAHASVTRRVLPTRRGRPREAGAPNLHDFRWVKGILRVRKTEGRITRGFTPLLSARVGVEFDQLSPCTAGRPRARLTPGSAFTPAVLQV